MPWRPHGKAKVNPGNPEAFGICDRCRSLYNRRELKYQTVRNGNQLQPTRIAVCRMCIDIPRPPSNRAIPPDGQPIKNARPEVQRAPYPTEAS